MNYSLGIDLGNASVKAIVLNNKKEIVYQNYITHLGKPIVTAQIILGEISEKFTDNQGFTGMFTGVNASGICNKSCIISDIPAIDKGLSLLCPTAKSAIEIGAQNARFLTLLNSDISPKFSVNESCAGGTGSFFEDQMYRLGLKIEDYSSIIEKAKSIPRLSGRCSVFAKTDIIHRQQEGFPTADILLGLCYATIRNIKATIIKNMPVEKPLALCGGIINNKGVIDAVKDIFELSDENFLVAPENVYIQAAGAAIIAMEQKNVFSIADSIKSFQYHLENNGSQNTIMRLSPLKLLHDTNTWDPICASIIDVDDCSLGIDVGSTSTNLVLTNQKGEIVDFQYLRTKGDPQGIVKAGLLSINERLGNKVNIKSVGVTGSGRHLIGKMVGADTIKDEITAQAKAAVCVYPHADTVFEIGGQDSKYISIKNGDVTDFQMNKICAAGTGSFIEEQSGRLNIPLDKYGSIALSATSPVDLGERCSVFIESNISSCMAKGVKIPDILAGLCYSVIHNYLFKVVGNKHVGKHIILQGGVCYNPAVVAAFQAVYGDKVTVSPYFSVSGAYGVSIIAAGEIELKQTTFKGLDLSCENVEININNQNTTQQNIAFYDKAKKYLLGDYTGNINSNKLTIGVPYVLVVHKLFPMIKAFFESLGYNVLLSPETNEKIIASSQKYAQAETCYPVKLIYGHMSYLAEKNVDYIFMPSILTMKHEHSKVYHNYGCVYMQTAPKLVFETMGLNKRGMKLLNPIFSLDFGQQAMASVMVGVGVSLGKNKALCVKALLAGAMAVRKHTAQVEKLGKELLSALKPDEKILVIVTRTYGIDDPVLNMCIPQELLQRGYKVITLAHLPAHSMDISAEYDNLYWPFGQHIISGAKLIANHPNLYAVYLTNHGCGPDTMLSHLFSKEMGNKPYLNIEVDEHFSKVGVITRIEAFLNSLQNRKTAIVKKNTDYFVNLPERSVIIPKIPQRDKPLYLPYLYPHSELVADMLNKNGYNADVLPQTNAKSLALGRSKTRSKEYLSFVALAGDVLQKSVTGEKMQILIPQTEGSEADGMYGRVIYDMLNSIDNVQLVCPTFETLPFTSTMCQKFFFSLLAGDVVMSAGKNQRSELMKLIREMVEISITSLLELAKQITPNDRKKIAIVGEPYTIFNSFLNESLFDSMERENRTILWMPMSEYLCFMWKKRAETSSEKEIVCVYENQIKEISVALCENSPFANDLEELFSIAEKSLPQLTGANGAYRFAKKSCVDNCVAIIDASSMYENVQTILDLVGPPQNLPTLSLNFEGSNDVAAKEKLHSFLYYIERN